VGARRFLAQCGSVAATLGRFSCSQLTTENRRLHGYPLTLPIMQHCPTNRLQKHDVGLLSRLESVGMAIAFGSAD
jgi:hypothetical protein